MKKLLALLIALTFAALIPASHTKADGMVLPPPGYFVQETEQKAVIIYQDNVEQLIVSIGFQSDAKDFAWIIPTPSKPEVDKSTDELFTGLEDLTDTYTYRGISDGMAPLSMEKAAEPSVTVLESKKVDIYDIVVLQATNSKDLAKWLNENKYVYPEKEAYLFDSYIKKGWFFVGAKINSKLLDSSGVRKLNDGHATPLKLTFTTDKIVFPMKISSVVSEQSVNNNGNVIVPEVSNNKNDTPVSSVAPPNPDIYYPDYPRQTNIPINLYIFADHKKELPGFNTDYAASVKKDRIRNLAYIDGEPWYDPGKDMYLTKLTRYMALSEMTDDLYPRDAEDDTAITDDLTKGKIFLIIALVSAATIVGSIVCPCGILFIIGSLMHISKKRKNNLIGWVFQWIGFALMFITEAVVAGYLIFQENEIERDSKFALMSLSITLGVIIVALATVMVLQKVKLGKRKKQ